MSSGQTRTPVFAFLLEHHGYLGHRLCTFFLEPDRWQKLLQLFSITMIHCPADLLRVQQIIQAVPLRGVLDFAFNKLAQRVRFAFHYGFHDSGLIDFPAHIIAALGGGPDQFFRRAFANERIQIVPLSLFRTQNGVGFG